MGSIVKSIGKAIKGIGKALKKIAPVLLMAAAIYVGYGYMTGFQSGGWPKIIDWGKSLMSGISQGQTISQAATAATDIGAVAGAETAALAGAETAALGAADAVTTALPAQEAVTAMPIGDVGATVAGGADAMMAEGAAQAGFDQNLWPNMIEKSSAALDSVYEEISTGLTGAWDNLSFNPISSAHGVGFGQSSTSPAMMNANVNQAAVESLGIDPGGLPTGSVERSFEPSMSAYDQAMAADVSRTDLTRVADFAGPHINDPSAMSRIAALGKKAWDLYKKMWADNPGMAMWTTSNVLKTILALMDDSEEKESYRRRHVAGFAPGGWDDVAKRYGGNLPGGRGGGAGYSQAGRRSMELKPGRIPEARQSRTSAIDRKPAGIIGSSLQREVV
jgi:hypothetical protein